MEEKQKLYYIQKGYVGNAIRWWALNSRGYTEDIANAQKYTLEEAMLATSNPDCNFWPCEYIDNLSAAKKTVIDSQFLDNIYMTNADHF